MSAMTDPGRALLEDARQGMYGDYMVANEPALAELAKAIHAIEVAARRRLRVHCVCGHVWSSHRQDPDDLTVQERCHCGCAGYQDTRELRMQVHDDD